MGTPSEKQQKPADVQPSTPPNGARESAEQRTSDPHAVWSRRDGARSALTRLAPFPSEIDLGTIPLGTQKTLELPLIVTDGYIGMGSAVTSIESLRGNGDEKAFSAEPTDVSYNAYSRANTIGLRFSPRHDGLHRMRVAVTVRWTDGTTTYNVTRLSARAETREGEVRPDTPIDKFEVGSLYDKTGNARAKILAFRQQGVNSVQVALTTTDPPSIGDRIVDAAFTFGLGFVTGGLSQMLAGALTKMPEVIPKGMEALSENAANAWQTGFDDAMKAGVEHGRAVLTRGDDSQAMRLYLEAQREALENANHKLSDRDVTNRTQAERAIETAPAERQGAIIATHVAVASRLLAAVNQIESSAKPLQIEGTLAGWMRAQARTDLGETTDPNAPGTDLEAAVNVSPPEFFKKDGARGVVHIAFGTRRERPYGGRIKVTGLTKAALDLTRSTKIGLLKMPIVASGYLVDGLVDAMGDHNNEIAFGKNESGSVFWKGHDNALDVLVKQTRASTVEGAVREVIRDDIEHLTLASAENRS